MYSESGIKSRILSVDPGTKRTGFALSDPIGITAQGLETFESDGGSVLLEHIEGLIREYEVSTVVIGLPLSMSGREIEGTKRSRQLAEDIKERCEVQILLRDERMSSLEVERIMKQEGKIKRAADIDRLSAVLLLQNYLDESAG
ncbi:MAG: Holliday junction resolvase RuvX [Candidatus Krumholzibacteriota bacterium]|nr:Holliday junction resolvase RuvX [Candidatus Krumholzibacteriota bacterium]